jgi:putative transcriptional regulator
MSRRVFALLTTLLAAFAIFSHSVRAHAGPDDALILVAQPQLIDPLYASSVLLVKPLPNGGHAGFIVNKPTRAHLGEVFPDHEPSKKVADPLFLGGPEDMNTVFALVERGRAKKDGAVQITPEIFLAVAAKDVDGVIESEADHARFLVGIVLWKPGELDEEMERGFWYQLEPDAKIVLRKDTAHLWDELVRKGEDRKHST